MTTPARRIVKETLKQGHRFRSWHASQDVNANQVFKRRKQYREGRMEMAAEPQCLEQTT